MAKSTQFPSVKELLSESWITTKGVIFRYYFWSVVSGVTLLAALIGIGLLLISVPMYVSSSQIEVPVVLTAIYVFASILTLYIALLAIAANFFSVSLKLLAEYPQKRSLKEMISQNWKKGLSLALLLVIHALFISSWFVFIIPGILVTMVLSFSMLGVILKDRGAWAATKRSVVLWQSHPRELFIKYFLMSIALMIASFLPYFVQGLISATLPDTTAGILNGFVSLAGLIFSLVFSVFFAVYPIKVFEAAEKATPENTRANMWWIWITTGVGWLLIVGTVILIVGFLRSPSGQEFMKETSEKTRSEIENKFEESTILDQEGIDSLSQKSFDELNKRRVAAGNKPLAKDPLLCEYGKTLLEAVEAGGNQPDVANAVLTKDLQNPAIYKKYFNGYTMVTYVAKAGPRNIDTPESIVDDWNTPTEDDETDLVADKSFRAGCVTGNKDHILIVPVR